MMVDTTLVVIQVSIDFCDVLVKCIIRLTKTNHNWAILEDISTHSCFTDGTIVTSNVSIVSSVQFGLVWATVWTFSVFANIWVAFFLNQTKIFTILGIVSKIYFMYLGYQEWETTIALL
jgi:hypothetical protein